MFIKKDLSYEILHGITLRKIRDAFKKICFDSFEKTDLATWLFEKEIKKLFQEYHKVSDKPTVADIRTKFILAAKDGYDPDYHGFYGWLMTEKIPCYLSITEDIIDYLHKEEMIKPATDFNEDGSLWEIEQQGHSLRNQLALKRISRARGIELLTKIKKNIIAYNNNPENCFNIDAVVLYGSIVTDSETVGDIDLFYYTSYRRLEGEEVMDWIKREKQQQVKHGYKVGRGILEHKTIGVLEKQIKISPYISAAPAAGVKEEVDNGMHLHIWYFREGHILSEELEQLPKIDVG